MIRINQLKLNIKHSEADLKEKILKTLCISEDSLLSYEIKNSPWTREGSQNFTMYMPWM
ncbi:hypothetical protein HMPREF0993_01215 [Lachnospiraceae bacterium 5_1_57FAA]|nr:hypothetical protein HMPREF0993_01215 [Lachnospiraceae bacterium 5_1_57FAA]